MSDQSVPVYNFTNDPDTGFYFGNNICIESLIEFNIITTDLLTCLDLEALQPYIINFECRNQSKCLRLMCDDWVVKQPTNQVNPRISSDKVVQLLSLLAESNNCKVDDHLINYLTKQLIFNEDGDDKLFQTAVTLKQSVNFRYVFT